MGVRFGWGMSPPCPTGDAAVAMKGLSASRDFLTAHLSERNAITADRPKSGRRRGARPGGNHCRLLDLSIQKCINHVQRLPLGFAVSFRPLRALRARLAARSRGEALGCSNRSDSPPSCGRGGGTRLLRTWTRGSFWLVFRKGTVSPQAHAWARCYRFCGQWPWLCSDDAQPPAVAQHTPHSTAAQKHVSSKVRPVAMAEVAAPPTLFPLRPCCCVPGTKQAPGRCSTVHPSLPHSVYRGRGTLQNVCPYRRWPERPASGDEAALAVGGSGGTARPSPVHRRGKARPVPLLRR